MRNGVTGVFGLAVLAFAASLMGSPALAKCTKECKTLIKAEFKSCKTACPKGSAGKACKKTCKDEKKGDATDCKNATSPTPPNCGSTAEPGDDSPSAAFLD